jgi:NADP-dependent 3-hydroxy acid dehydrogenase YdfG
MSEATELRARASHYRTVAEGADVTSQRELLRIAADFEDEAARLDMIATTAGRAAGNHSGR